MQNRNKIYFASDFHLGSGSYLKSREREDAITRWLDEVKMDAAELFLMGDIFDFWFEYKTVVPKGYIRFLGKLAQLTDAGVKLYLFKGNHDMWMFDYFVHELGATIVSNELEITRNGKTFYLHHGDGLGPGDAFYKVLKKFFRGGFCQWLFARIHPNFGVGLANYWSARSRKSQKKTPEYAKQEQEWLVIFSKELLKTQTFNYFIFGHRHVPMDVELGNNSRYINLGEWLFYKSFAVFDGENITLKYFEQA